MKPHSVVLLLASLLLWAALPATAFCELPEGAGNSAVQEPGLADSIRPMVGTYGGGNTYPGPTAPFGMVQLSPDTETQLWDTASGYEYSDPTILGFSLTHLSGTGCPELGDFLFMPQVGPPQLVPGLKKAPNSGYQSPFSHDDESASAGYYRVKLQKSGVTVELTAGLRASILRMTFPETDQASVLTDLSHFISGRGGRWSGRGSASRTHRR